MAASECGDLLEIRREHEETWEMKEDEKARMGPDEEGNSILSQGGSLRQSILQRIRRTATIRRGEIKKRSKQAENQAARSKIPAVRKRASAPNLNSYMPEINSPTQKISSQIQVLLLPSFGGMD